MRAMEAIEINVYSIHNSYLFVLFDNITAWLEMMHNKIKCFTITFFYIFLLSYITYVVMFNLKHTLTDTVVHCGRNYDLTAVIFTHKSRVKY